MKHASKKVILAAILGEPAICVLIRLGSSWCPLPELLQVPVHHLLFVALLMALGRGSRGRRLLTAVMLLTVQILTGLLAESLISLVLLAGLYLVNPDPSLVLGEHMIWLTECLSYLSTAAAILLLGRLCSGFSDFAGGEEESWPEELPFQAATESSGERPGRWYVVLSLPLLGFTAVADVAIWGASYGILVRSGGWLELYYDQLLSHGGMCVLAVLLLLAAVFYLFGMEQMKREGQKSRWYHAQLEAYRMMEQQHRRTESLRHDMKNHILALKGLVEGREWEKLGLYLEHMAASSSLDTGRAATGNRVVDILLEQKEGQARGLGVSWDCQVQIPCGCGIREIDWCILLGNLLDNALEACGRMAERENAQIRLQAGRAKGCFFLEIENSVDAGEAVQRDEIAGISREGKEGYGIGLGNVRDLTERYDGTMEIEQGRGSFRVSVLLPLRMEPPAQDMKGAV